MALFLIPCEGRISGRVVPGVSSLRHAPGNDVWRVLLSMSCGSIRMQVTLTGKVLRVGGIKERLGGTWLCGHLSFQSILFSPHPGLPEKHSRALT